MAGALLFEKIISVCQQHGCKVDADFPYCILINYPFSTMLTDDLEKKLLQNQLFECFNCLSTNQISIAAIACNTLHVFLPPLPKEIHLVHMIVETKEYVESIGWHEPLILCSSTSVQSKLHAQYFPCRYPDNALQKKIDNLIDEITRGCCLKNASKVLSDICNEEGPTILGCTELTLAHERTPLESKEICAPDSLVAEKIGKIIFKNENSYH